MLLPHTGFLILSLYGVHHWKLDWHKVRIYLTTSEALVPVKSGASVQCADSSLFCRSSVIVSWSGWQGEDLGRVWQWQMHAHLHGLLKGMLRTSLRSTHVLLEWIIMTVLADCSRF